MTQEEIVVTVIILLGFWIVMFIYDLVVCPHCVRCKQPFIKALDRFDVKLCVNCGEINLGKGYKQI